ncbi:MAG: hypothetical protein WAT71_02025 [Ignavibacteria bacterium]
MKNKKTLKFNTLYNSLSDSEKLEFYEYLKSSLSPKLQVPKSVIENFKTGVELSEIHFDKLTSQRLWNINSQLTKALEMFFALKELNNDPEQIFRLAAIQMNKRNLNKMVQKSYVKRINDLSNSNIHEKTFRKLSDTCMEYIHSLLTEDDKKKQAEVYELYNKFFSLSMIFELIIMRFNNEVTSIFSKDSENYFLNDFFKCIDFSKILELLKNNFPRYYPVIRLWHYFYELYSMKFDIVQYNKVKNYLFEIMDQLSDELNTSSLNVLTDLLIIKREELGADVDRELFEVFFKKESKGLTEDFKLNKIGYNHFRDNIFIALKVGEIEWAEYFLNKYSETLPENQKINDVNTGKAQICLSKGQFKDAINFIGKINKSFYIHYSDYFRISIKSYFELAKYNECISLAEKYKEYLKRNKNLPDSFVNGSKLFIKNVTHLSEYKITSDKKHLNHFELSKLKNQNLSNNWLLDKFNKLIKSNNEMKNMI